MDFSLNFSKFFQKVKRRLQPTKCVLLSLSLLVSYVSHGQEDGSNWAVSFTDEVEISPEAVYLDAAKFLPFYQGYSIVSKGTKSWVINNSGEQITPLGDYHLVRDYSTGLNAATDNFFIYQNFIGDGKRELSFIRRDGKIIPLDPKDSFLQYFNKSGVAVVVNDVDVFSVDSTGKRTLLRKYSFPDGSFGNVDAAHNLDDLVPFQYKAGNDVLGIGYRHYYSGEKVIGPRFLHAEKFHDGLAAVQVEDDFGIKRWGFIDRTGTYAVPPRYLEKPRNFSSGRAFVIPNDQSEYDAAFIDKRGEVKIRFTKKYRNEEISVTDFQDGFAVTDIRTSLGKSGLVDTTGNYFSAKHLVSMFGIVPPEFEGEFYVDEYAAGIAYVVGVGHHVGRLALHLKAFGWERIKGPYTTTNNNYDPVSGLRLLQLKIGTDRLGRDIFMEGFVNHQGQFVIIREENLDPTKIQASGTAGSRISQGLNKGVYLHDTKDDEFHTKYQITVIDVGSGSAAFRFESINRPACDVSFEGSLKQEEKGIYSFNDSSYPLSFKLTAIGQELVVSEVKADMSEECSIWVPEVKFFRQ